MDESRSCWQQRDDAMLVGGVGQHGGKGQSNRGESTTKLNVHGDRVEFGLDCGIRHRVDPGRTPRIETTPRPHPRPTPKTPARFGPLRMASMIDSGKTVACRLLGRLNQLLNRAETSLGRTHLRSRPVDVDIVLSKACNLACTFCKDYETIGAKRISVRNVERIAAQIFPTARRLNICSGGEPYLHTGLENVLRIARRYGLFTWVLSNGTILDERRLRAIVREGLIDEQGFSVDGYEAATVEAIRVNARLVTIRANIDMLLRLRHEEGRRLPRIVIRYALMRSNIEELPAAVRHWGEKGIDRIDCGYLSLANAMERDESLFRSWGVRTEHPQQGP